MVDLAFKSLMTEPDPTLIFSKARSLDTNAGQIIAGVAGVDFSRIVWTRDVDEDFSMSACDQAKMRTWVWEVMMPLASKDMLNNKTLQPTTLAMNMLMVLQSFQAAEKAISKKSLGPMVLACCLEATNDVCDMFLERFITITSEDNKIKLACFLRRHPSYASTFCVYVGYTLLMKQMVQNGTSNTIRKHNALIVMKNSASLRLRDMLITRGSQQLMNDFNTVCMNRHDKYIVDWKTSWHKAFADAMLDDT